MMEVKLGMNVIDRETGFRGKVTAKAQYLYDEPRALVENIDSTGRPIEWWFTMERLEEEN